MPTSWKSYPKPNPWFEPREPRAWTARAETLARVAPWLAWALYLGGCLVALTAHPITGSFKPFVNWGLLAIFFGIVALCVAIPLYRAAVLRRIVETREFIPALTEARGNPWWFIVLVTGPLLIVSLGAGLIGGLLMGVERYGKFQIRVHFVCNGRRHRKPMLVSKHSRHELLDDEVVWITRPHWLVPPVPVNRMGATFYLDNATYEASDWLLDAFDRVAMRRARIRRIRRRARAIRKLRHDSGRDHRYR